MFSFKIDNKLALAIIFVAAICGLVQCVRVEVSLDQFSNFSDFLATFWSSTLSSFAIFSSWNFLKTRFFPWFYFSPFVHTFSETIIEVAENRIFEWITSIFTCISITKVRWRNCIISGLTRFCQIIAHFQIKCVINLSSSMEITRKKNHLLLLPANNLNGLKSELAL